MRDVPAESTVLVEGVVIERPPNQKRPVRTSSHIRPPIPVRIPPGGHPF